MTPEPAVIMESDQPASPWYALRVKSRFEKTAAAILRNKGYHEFLPLYHSRRFWSDRVVELDLPLFPGYVFCRLDLADRRVPVLTTPGVVEIVGVGRTPVPVDESEIAAVQAIIKSGLAAEPWPFLKIGHLVRIEHGSLAGLEGILVELKKRHRLVVSVTLLQRSVAVEIDRTWVAALRLPHTAAQPLAHTVGRASACPDNSFSRPLRLCGE